jgi:hypothetical protein
MFIFLLLIFSFCTSFCAEPYSIQFKMMEQREPYPTDPATKEPYPDSFNLKNFNLSSPSAICLPRTNHVSKEQEVTNKNNIVWLKNRLDYGNPQTTLFFPNGESIAFYLKEYVNKSDPLIKIINDTTKLIYRFDRKINRKKFQFDPTETLQLVLNILRAEKAKKVPSMRYEIVNGQIKIESENKVPMLSNTFVNMQIAKNEAKELLQGSESWDLDFKDSNTVRLYQIAAANLKNTFLQFMQKELGNPDESYVEIEMEKKRVIRRRAKQWDEFKQKLDRWKKWILGGVTALFATGVLYKYWPRSNK